MTLGSITKAEKACGTELHDRSHSFEPLQEVDIVQINLNLTQL
jgi:hypothetical protein